MVRTSIKWSIAQDIEEFYEPEPEPELEEEEFNPDDYDNRYDMFYL
jgi:hypothetical protein